MNSLGKRGVSGVVATVALILITVAAAVFIAGFVVPLVKTQLSEGTECLGYEEYFIFYEDFGYNCYSKTVELPQYFLTAVSIEANTVSQEKLDNLGGMRLQFRGAGEELGIEVVNGASADSNKLRMLKVSDTTLSVPEKGGVKTYVLNSSVKYDGVEVYPVLKNGRICEQTDKIKIAGVPCNPQTPMSIP